MDFRWLLLCRCDNRFLYRFRFIYCWVSQFYRCNLVNILDLLDFMHLINKPHPWLFKNPHRYLRRFMLCLGIKYLLRFLKMGIFLLYNKIQLLMVVRIRRACFTFLILALLSLLDGIQWQRRIFSTQLWGFFSLFYCLMFVPFRPLPWLKWRLIRNSYSTLFHFSII